MWKFNPFGQKEQAGLEGRVMDVGNIKLSVRNPIGEGGFSCVYLARDASHPSKQYALKHMICNDSESLELATKEISVMKLLKAHPNVITLVAHSIIDMGRTKEVFLVMEFCEKSLVGTLEGRGAGHFEEKQLLTIFRDICNAVFAMHNQSPPIAHRDLKVENVLLGSDGAWKLCDFGSTSTNHKRFDRPEEMGVEEDNIRKYTTPAYRAPEMWDLYRREVISEKADIWALGCLLYRICYFKSAFDGESKLQILNGNYKIPEFPKYSTSITGLIKDMLEGSPDSRPDITQIWFRVNEQLPIDIQKDLPDGSVSSDARLSTSASNNEGTSKKVTHPMPRRSPPPPPTKEQARNGSSLPVNEFQHSQDASKATGSSASIGSFWSSQHAQDSHVAEDKGPVFDDDTLGQTTANFFPAHVSEITKPPPRESGGGAAFRNEAFNSFVAEFDASKLYPINPPSSVKTTATGKEELEAEVVGLKEQLKQANMEKAEISSKFEKLSAICRSQRQEIQELKQALAAAAPLRASNDGPKSQPSPGSTHPTTPSRDKMAGTIWDLQQGMFDTSSSASAAASPSPDSKPWHAFASEPKPQPTTPTNSGHPKSVRTTSNGSTQSLTKHQAESPAKDDWGFQQDGFKSALLPRNSASAVSATRGSQSQRFSSSKDSGEAAAAAGPRPAGWADF